MKQPAEYTQGVCGDGVVMLADGLPITVDEALVVLNSTLWREISEADDTVKYGQVVRLAHASWVNPDFNPSGSVEGYWQDDLDHPQGGTWIGAFWNACQDCWDAKPCVPSHFMELPPPCPSIS